MKDRVPSHPGRVRLTRISEDIYDMSMADDPTEAGTPLSKATLLKDSTAEKYGFLPSDNPTPDDIFNAAFDELPVIRLDGVWTSHDIARFDAQNLSAAGDGLAGGSIGDYALFAGMDATVDAYDETYARTSAQQLSAARRYLACASCGTYLFFAGGLTTSSSNRSSVVDVYDEMLTRITTLQLSAARAYLAGASVGDYAIFAGGDAGIQSDVVDAYGDGLVRIVLTSLNQGRSSLTGVSAGDYAIFAGGDYSTKYAVVDAYDEAFVHTALTQLSVARTELAGAFVGGFALFGGGDRSTSSSSISSNVVDAYDTSSMTHTTATALSTARYALASTSINGYAIFAGGQTETGSNYVSDVVDAYDTTLTICSLPKLSVARRRLAGATAGASAIFAGGYGNYASKDDVDAYKLAYGLNVTIPAWSKYMIDGITSEEQFTQTDTQISGFSDNPFNGYIKRSFRLSGEI